MKHSSKSLRRSALAVFTASAAAIAFLAAPAYGQGKADIGKLNFDDVPSPDIQGVKNKSFKPKDWLEVEAGIKLAGNPQQQKTGFIDQVTVKWYVAVDNPDTRGVVKLTKTINHINVPVGEEIFTSVYLSPNTIKRLTGKDRAGKNALKAAGLEVLVDGVKVGETAVKEREGWWNAPSLSDQSDRFPLLNKNETPFQMAWWDRYAEIQKER